jgi:hypothetical protein
MGLLKEGDRRQADSSNSKQDGSFQEPSYQAGNDSSPGLLVTMFAETEMYLIRNDSLQTHRCVLALASSSREETDRHQYVSLPQSVSRRRRRERRPSSLYSLTPTTTTTNRATKAPALASMQQRSCATRGPGQGSYPSVNNVT